MHPALNLFADNVQRALDIARIGHSRNENLLDVGFSFQGAFP